MTEELMKLQIFNGAMQVNSDSIKYLANKLEDTTDSVEPSFDELKLCYYDAENISRLLIDCIDTIKDCLEKSESIIEDLRHQKLKG